MGYESDGLLSGEKTNRISLSFFCHLLSSINDNVSLYNTWGISGLPA